MLPRKSRSNLNLTNGLLLVSSVFLLAGGIFCVARFPSVFSSTLRDELTIVPGKAAYDAWVKPEIPTKVRFFFFSIKNPVEVIAGSKPYLQEIGPFVYREELERVETTFSDDYRTVSFRTRKVWYPVEEESLSLDEMITTLDIPQFAAAESVRGQWSEYGMAMTLSWRDSLFINRTARELLFQGFSDPLMTVGSLLNQDNPVPMDKFGWFYKRNGTTWSDDVIKMATGVGDYQHVGEIREWRGSNRTHYPGECGKLRGSPTGFFPIDETVDYLEYFSTDICRPIRLTKTSSWSHNGIPVSRFTLQPFVTFGNTSTNPDNWCYFPNHAAGIHNATGCKDSGILPVFVSLPHFLDSDPIYLDQFLPGSLRPDPTIHQAVMVVNTNTSIPLEVQMRMQIIMHVRKNSNLGRNFQNLRDTFLPLLWFDVVAAPTPAMESQIWYLVNMVEILSDVGIGLIVLGSVLGGVLTLLLAKRVLAARGFYKEKSVAPLEGNLRGAGTTVMQTCLQQR